MIFKAIFQGLALGFALALSLGPSFFALIQTSTKRGFKPALGLAFGIFLSDVLCVLLAYFGVAQFFDNPQNKKTLKQSHKEEPCLPCPELAPLSPPPPLLRLQRSLSLELSLVLALSAAASTETPKECKTQATTSVPKTQSSLDLNRGLARRRLQQNPLPPRRLSSPPHPPEAK